MIITMLMSSYQTRQVSYFTFRRTNFFNNMFVMCGYQQIKIIFTRLNQPQLCATLYSRLEDAVDETKVMLNYMISDIVWFYHHLTLVALNI
jgi:hypothetical protein